LIDTEILEENAFDMLLQIMGCPCGLPANIAGLTFNEAFVSEINEKATSH
jgi:hypothetical protein